MAHRLVTGCANQEGVSNGSAIANRLITTALTGNVAWRMAGVGEPAAGAVACVVCPDGGISIATSMSGG